MNARSIDELVKEIVISMPPLRHHGTKKVIVMNQRLAARVSSDDDAIERLLESFQAVHTNLATVTSAKPPHFLAFSLLHRG